MESANTDVFEKVLFTVRSVSVLSLIIYRNVFKRIYKSCFLTLSYACWAKVALKSRL